MNKFLIVTITSLIGITGGCTGQAKRTTETGKTDTTYEITTNRQGDTLDITPIVNGKPNGQFRSYYEKGKVWNTSQYVNGKINGESITYTPDGKVAIKEIWTNSTLTEQIIFWQEVPYTNTKEFYFLSDTGIYKIKDGKYLYNLESHPPEGFIIEKYEGASPVYYVYKNGKFEHYPIPEE